MDTLKCVMLNGSPDMTLIIYTTCYDIKSFYMVSTISEKNPVEKGVDGRILHY